MCALYQLKYDYADPRLSQLSFSEESPSVLGNSELFEDFKPKNAGKLSWEPNRLAEIWSPPEVEGDIPGFCDFTTVDRIPLLSRRAIAALEDLLQPSVERLPCRTAVGEYFALNILAVSDAFDRERADADFSPTSNKETAFSIDRFEFQEDRLGDHAIFRIREYPVMDIVDDRFVRRVEQTGLYGFYFVKIWPFAQEESWEDIELQRKRQRKKEGVIGQLRSQCIEIRLPVSDQPRDGDEPSDQDYAAAGVLFDKLGGALAQRESSEDDFVGAVEQFEPGPGDIVITIICPNSDHAFDAVESELKAINWRFPIHVELYPGSPFDSSIRPTKLVIG